MKIHGISLIITIVVLIFTGLLWISSVAANLPLDPRCDDIWQFPVCPLTIPVLCTPEGPTYGYRCLLCLFGWLNDTDTTGLLDRSCLTDNPNWSITF